MSVKRYVWAVSLGEVIPILGEYIVDGKIVGVFDDTGHPVSIIDKDMIVDDPDKANEAARNAYLKLKCEAEDQFNVTKQKFFEEMDHIRKTIMEIPLGASEQ